MGVHALLHHFLSLLLGSKTKKFLLVCQQYCQGFSLAEHSSHWAFHVAIKKKGRHLRILLSDRYCRLTGFLLALHHCLPPPPPFCRHEKALLEWLTHRISPCFVVLSACKRRGACVLSYAGICVGVLPPMARCMRAFLHMLLKTTFGSHLCCMCIFFKKKCGTEGREVIKNWIYILSRLRFYTTDSGKGKKDIVGKDEHT